MVGRDLNSSPTQYRTWVVPNTPDFDGYYYTGLKSGDSPLIDVTTYNLDGYDGYPVDFSLPQPLSWKTTLRSMPDGVYNSQLAILDGYAYLFGGELSDIIWRADLNNPCDWFDSGGRLPSPLAGACLGIVDGYMYLIGGTNDGYLAVDTIYKASVADPLTWTNEGSKLPRTLRQSQLAILPDGYMYLFGGKEVNLATDVIFRASVTDPLTWEDTLARLPIKMYGSQLAFIGTNMYLLGGLLFEDAALATIYQAPITTPLVWTAFSSLPFPSAYGQYVSIGDHGYLYTASAFVGSQPYHTRIYRCLLANPGTWTDTNKVVPGNISQSQLAIIYDRMFLLGGNGNSAIFACDQKHKYKLGAGTPSFFYGDVTRTQYQAISDPVQKTILLGFPYWKTDYKP